MNQAFETNQKRKKVFCISVIIILSLVIGGSLLSGTAAVYFTEIGFRQNVNFDEKLEWTGLNDLKVSSLEFYTYRKEDHRAEVGFGISFESAEIEKYAYAEEDSQEAMELLSIMRNILAEIRSTNYAADVANGWEVKISSSASGVHIEDSQGRSYYYYHSVMDDESKYSKLEYLQIEDEYVIYETVDRNKEKDNLYDNDSDSQGKDFGGPLREEDLFYHNYKNKSDRYDVYDYKGADDFYDDNYDDFESYDDAETYFEDAWRDY